MREVSDQELLQEMGRLHMICVLYEQAIKAKDEEIAELKSADRIEQHPPSQ